MIMVIKFSEPAFRSQSREDFYGEPQKFVIFFHLLLKSRRLIPSSYDFLRLVSEEEEEKGKWNHLAENPLRLLVSSPPPLFLLNSARND